MANDLGTRTPETLTFTASDGVDIVMDIWRTSPDPQPIVLCMTPYLRSTFAAFGDTPVTALNEMGITVMVADIRGTGESGGVFSGPLGEREIDDGVELIEWLSATHSSNGKVALVGPSYCGANQLLMAARRPRGLAAIAPAVAPIDMFRDWTHWGGIPTHGGWAAMNFLARKQPAASQKALLDFYYNTLMVAAVDGPLFRERSPAYVLDRIAVPALVVGGLFDFFSRATLRTFEALRVPKRLVFGPWGHSYPPEPTELLNWFGYWLLGRGADPTLGDNVHLWRLGAGHWVRQRDTGAPAGTALPLSDGPIELPVVGTSAALPPQTLPLPPSAGADPQFGWGEAHHIEIELPDAMEVWGAPVLDAVIDSPDAVDVDLFVRLSLVGDSTLQLCEGRLRLSHRALDEAMSTRDSAGTLTSVRLQNVDPAPLSATGNRVAIELLPTSLSLPAGSRLRVGFSAVRADGRQRRTHLVLSAASRLILPRST